MVFPLAVLGAASVIGGHAARIGITSAHARQFAGTFAQSLPFGAGYSFGTYVGFPKNYQSTSYYARGSSVNLGTGMPYGRRYGFGANRRYRRSYGRFGRRYPYYPRSYRRYGRY